MSSLVETLAPSLKAQPTVTVTTGNPGENVQATAILVASDLPVPDKLGLDLSQLQRAGFTPKVGGVLAFPSSTNPVLVAVGIGPISDISTASIRDAAAAFARAIPADSIIATEVSSVGSVSASDAAAAVVEGVLLARYDYALRSIPRGPAPLEELIIVTSENLSEEVAEGVRRGTIVAQAACLARDLAGTPSSILTATAMADLAVELGERFGFAVEVFDKEDLTELGCGGILGVNRGSIEPPRMIKATYSPADQSGHHLALVGKGIMYDSGGISLKPGDLSHSQMKNDMTGAGDILAAFTSFQGLGVTTKVTAFLMCTDNMPSGSAMQLGDVLTTRSGKTIEVINSDAEGRLVMADALVLATELNPDAIIDIATLTGACLRTFGDEMAGIMGNSPDLIAQVRQAGDAVDEPVWELPLIKKYRPELDSDVADIKNLGGANAGSITAGLFLEEFVAGYPWVHIDIAGTAQSASARRWINKGATGFGTRLLIETIEKFEAPASN